MATKKSDPTSEASIRRAWQRWRKNNNDVYWIVQYLIEPPDVELVAYETGGRGGVVCRLSVKQFLEKRQPTKAKKNT